MLLLGAKSKIRERLITRKNKILVPLNKCEILTHFGSGELHRRSYFLDERHAIYLMESGDTVKNLLER